MYEAIAIAFIQNDAGSLREVSERASAMPGPFASGLAVLARAAAAFRSDDLRGCAASLDSLDATLPREAVAPWALAFRIRSMLRSAVGDASAGVLEADTGLARLRGMGLHEEEVALMVVRAEALTQLERMSDALEQFEAARTLADRAGSERGRCMVQLGMGNIRYAQGRYEEAHHLYREALAAAVENGYRKLEESAFANLAGVTLMLGDLEKADRLYDSLLTRLQDRSPELRSRILDQKGYLRIELGDPQAAIPWCTKALALADAIGDERAATEARIDLAYAYWGVGRREEAIDGLQKALVWAARTGNLGRQRDLEWELSEWYRESGRTDEALRYLADHAAHADSLARMRFAAEVAASEVRFNAALKERRIIAQQQALQLAEAEQRRKRIQRDLSIVLSAALLVVAILLWRGLRIRRRLAERARQVHRQQVDELMHQQEMKAINAMLEGQEKERDRVARDLHDRLGSMLSAIKMQVGSLEERVTEVRKDQQDQYGKVSSLLDEAVGEVRRISHDLVSTSLSRFGLERALQDLCDSIRVSGRLEVELTTFGLEQRLERSVEIVVYRIVQELVSNALKHARATEIGVSVTRQTGRLSVMVSDDGAGFDPSTVQAGMGLGNVQGRAASIGGTVRIDSALGRGTTVSVECPVLE